MELSDSTLEHLRRVAALPDLSGTRYDLENEIGRGGLGVVYAARDRDLDRRVALKVMEGGFARKRGSSHAWSIPRLCPSTRPERCRTAARFTR